MKLNNMTAYQEPGMSSRDAYCPNLVTSSYPGYEDVMPQHYRLLCKNSIVMPGSEVLMACLWVVPGLLASLNYGSNTLFP